MEKSDALEIYKVRIGEQATWLNLHRQTSQQYFVLISAIFAASLTIFFKKGIISNISFFGFFLNISLGFSAIGLCRRFYQRFLEEITITAKLESLIGLSDQRKHEHNNTVIPFPKDKYYIPERWLESRKDISTSNKFVNNHMKTGANKYIRLSFKYLILVNIIFIIIIILKLLF